MCCTPMPTQYLHFPPDWSLLRSLGGFFKFSSKGNEGTGVGDTYYPLPRLNPQSMMILGENKKNL